VGDLANLLGVYGNQFGTYTTLLWQVPALGLTAQAFLLTIALGDRSNGTTIMASGISIVVALASIFLMKNQRGHAIDHRALLQRVSGDLAVRLDWELGLATKTRWFHRRPPVDARNVWRVSLFNYVVWMACMALFVIADGAIILSTAKGLSWFK
jgi:hypothetical protein